MNANWTILVVYEGVAAREPAMRFCDGLVQRFWPDYSFELNWFEWAALEDPISAREAERKAKDASFLVVATGSQKMIPDRIQCWLEQAIRSRDDREGMLVGLTARDSEASGIQLYLRKLAHRSGMDYVTAIPQSLPHSVPESAESYHLRATQVTSVLGAILNRAHVPPLLS